jgi:hypothetical protein
MDVASILSVEMLSYPTALYLAEGTFCYECCFMNHLMFF